MNCKSCALLCWPSGSKFSLVKAKENIVRKLECPWIKVWMHQIKMHTILQWYTLVDQGLYALCLFTFVENSLQIPLVGTIWSEGRVWNLYLYYVYMLYVLFGFWLRVIQNNSLTLLNTTGYNNPKLFWFLTYFQKLRLFYCWISVLYLITPVIVLRILLSYFY